MTKPTTKNEAAQMLLRLALGDQGAELVEFAMTAWVLILLVFGIFQFGFAMYAYHFTSYAAQQGSRFAMVRGYTWSKNISTTCSTSAPPNFTMKYDCTASITDIQNFVQSLANPGIVPGSVSINTTSSYVWPGTASACTTNANSPGCPVQVTVNYTFHFVPFLPVASLPMSATSEKVILQ